MGLGAKLQFAFIAIIVMMATVMSGFTLVVDSYKAKRKAEEIITPVLKCASDEVLAVYAKNFAIAQALEADPDFKKAFAAKDRTAVEKAVKAVFDKFGFSGYATIILENNGLVFYSSDSPKKFGYSTSIMNKTLVGNAFNYVSGNPKFPRALCSLSDTGTCTLSSLVPIHSADNKVPAVLAVSTPFGNELLQGMERKIKLVNELKDFDIAFFVMLDARVTASSANLQNVKPSYLAKLNHTRTDPFGDREIVEESDGRLWKNLHIWGPEPNKVLGQIIASTPIQNPLSNVAMLGLQIAIAAVAAFLLSCLFTAGLSGRFNKSMRFLKQRAKDLAANKQEMPSLGVLDGEWLELAEMMDTAMTNPRAIIQNLKQNSLKLNEDLQEKQRQVDAINGQLETVNRQLTAHNRQSLDVNASVQNANRQAIQVQQKLEAVLQCSSEGFLLLDPYGSVVSANPIFLNWSGVQERDIAGKVCFDLVRKPGEPRQAQGLTFAHPGAGPEDLINQFYPEGIIYHHSKPKQIEVLM
ncbi:MAG: hypothetical protein K2X81_12180, partial [Candidatus Obscuribacterales bacterium]|nr:hypothetical protein [Candidatus Obscuribacterales bacterium]